MTQPHPMRRCRECGCVDLYGCWHDEYGSCSWVELDLCSACTEDADDGWEHPPTWLTAESSDWPEGAPAPDHSAELDELGEQLEQAMHRVDEKAAVLFGDRYA